MKKAGRELKSMRRVHVNGLIVSAVGLLIGTLVGCGVKGPPVPRQQAPPPAVNDLTCRVDGRTATLFWRLSGPVDRKSAGKTTFVVFHSRTDLDEEACENCPQVFERVATVPYTDKEDDRFSFDVLLDPGYRYAIKVHLEADGVAGPDSNSLWLNAYPDGPIQVMETP
jgi:hypothetical protein